MELVKQSYGIATAQCVYGGPRGVWLECTARGCTESDRIKGASVDISDADAATAFREGGWTGRGVRMLRARCPKCSIVR
jgi:hypothetical protein